MGHRIADVNACASEMDSAVEQIEKKFSNSAVWEVITDWTSKN
jgi:hypothetical protein